MKRIVKKGLAVLLGVVGVGLGLTPTVSAIVVKEGWIVAAQVVLVASVIVFTVGGLAALAINLWEDEP